MADYTTLIASLSSAEQPCRTLDALVWVELGDDWQEHDIAVPPLRLPMSPRQSVNGRSLAWCLEHGLRGPAEVWCVPRLTHDPGAVITLIRKTLPDADVNIIFSGEEASATFKIVGLGSATYEGANLALAMLVALFKILELKND